MHVSTNDIEIFIVRPCPEVLSVVASVICASLCSVTSIYSATSLLDTTLNVIFSVTYYLELRSAISFYC